MELSKLVAAYESLAAIKNKNDLQFSLAWSISDVMDSMEKHYFRYNEQRGDIVRKHGEKNPDDTFRVDPKNIESFNKEMMELLSHEVKFDPEKTIRLIDLIDAKLVVTKDVNLAAIKPFIINEKAIAVDKEAD